MAQTITCPHCGRQVEDSAFCTNCGQSLAGAGEPTTPPATEPAASGPAPAAELKSDAPPVKSGRIGKRLPRGNRGIRLLPVPVSGGTRLYRAIIAIGAILVLFSLLGGNAGTAIVIATVIVPLLFVCYLYAIDLYEDESRLALLLVGLWGGVIGLIIGPANAWLVGRLWIKHATFHIGAAGFGSRFADAAGLPPVSIFFLTGIALPLVALALLAIGPSALRRFPSFRNEVMDGITAGAAAGGGFAIATTIVFFWPLITSSANPGLDVGEWTGMLIGLVVLRPLILMAIVAIVCAGVWRLDPRQQTTEQRLPIVLGLGALVVYAVGDLFVQPSGARAEFVWLLVVAIIVWFAFRLMVTSALAEDRQLLGGRNLVVCPHCRKLTPPGAFCVACGKPLTPTPEPAPAVEPTVAEAPPPTPAPTQTAPAENPPEPTTVTSEPLAPERAQPEAAPADNDQIELPAAATQMATSPDVEQTRPLPETEPPAAEEPPLTEEPPPSEGISGPPGPVKSSSSLPHWLLSYEDQPKSDDKDPDKSDK